ncbi:MAG: electron transport complex subunit RsxB [Orrella sp.]
MTTTPSPLVDSLNALLPQTQCTKCGYDGCLPDAQAMALGQADINRCPPGGDAGVAKLAALLNKPTRPIDPDCGQHEPLQVAVIEEEHCIGCTLCIQACPVDAIIGANKKMHTVLSDWCTGCDLCVAPCPVDCIVMIPVQPITTWSDKQAQVARTRFEARERRLQHKANVAREIPKAATTDKQAVIAAALARARSRRVTP